MSEPQTPHTFGASTTAAEVIDGVGLHGRRAVVTAASSGIGVETARALAAAGAEVTLAVRDTDAGACVAARLEAVLLPESGELLSGRTPGAPLWSEGMTYLSPLSMTPRM